MKVMSFNIQHGVVFDDPEKKIDLRRFADFIRAEAPDIVGLCEVRGLPDGAAVPEDVNAALAEQAEILASLTGMHAVFSPAIRIGANGEGLYGNALLSRYPIRESETIAIPSPAPSSRLYPRHYEDRCILRAVLNTDEAPITVFVCHMGLNPDERLAAVQRLCRVLDECKGKKLLLGDFNMPPENELLQPIFARLTDTAVKIEGESLTFPSDSPLIKIDYIFASNTFEICSASVPRHYVSDHRVCLAELG